MNSKDKMIELLIGKLRKRITELDRDAARLNLVNKTNACHNIRYGIEHLQLAIEDLENA